jgi:T5SS/PEP-CTERM-associated repeat protein
MMGVCAAPGTGSSNPTLDMTGGVIQDTTGFVGGAQEGESSATIEEGRWTNSQELDVGTGNDGTLSISNDGNVSTGGGNLGGSPVLVVGYQATGVITVDGEGSALTASGDAIIGDGGTGTLAVTGGGSLDVSGTLSIAAAGSGSASLSGANASAEELAVGAGGSGTLTVGGSATLSVSGNASMGTAGSGTGTIQANGSLHIGGTFDLAATSGSTLTLQGGSLDAAALTIAGLASGYGGLTGPLTNTGTVVATGGTLVIGGAVTGGGSLDVGASGGAGVLELKNGAAAQQSIVFSAGTLRLDADHRLRRRGNHRAGGPIRRFRQLQRGRADDRIAQHPDRDTEPRRQLSKLRLQRGVGRSRRRHHLHALLRRRQWDPDRTRRNPGRGTAHGRPGRPGARRHGAGAMARAPAR